MTNKTLQASRRTLLLGLGAAATLPLLQGCFPLVAGGVGAGAAMVADRRTSGAYVEDEGIEWRTASALKDRLGDAVHINVTSFNRNVLLTGEAPTEAHRAEAERVASGIANVKGIVNEIQVAGISSLTSRGNDSLLTSKVKARFVDSAQFSANHVKVVTEAGTVFLLGIVTRREADAATEVARRTDGVRKVVKVFEYITDQQARQLEGKND
ncbi:BON domain-containing protein [Aromatoleum petrolei]|uniref:BON domain-containing protein n=1 Tax=Aromatoleum petrolei TaxID=76116 RepID=A0ABX1MQT4_9RHOO|nr:BON domain-containing protein [Aromatoleum petrolei]NMF87507.1 BON domain-containing protein [Aromatoleum petrolei]QTQ35877.1 BON domain-containing protein [Aromatoleum petrolei]